LDFESSTVINPKRAYTFSKKYYL